jgi:hypothetical protein
VFPSHFIALSILWGELLSNKETKPHQNKTTTPKKSKTKIPQQKSQ